MFPWVADKLAGNKQNVLLPQRKHRLGKQMSYACMKLISEEVCLHFLFPRAGLFKARLR